METSDSIVWFIKMVNQYAPLTGILMVLILVDIVFGLSAAIIQKVVCSTASFAGMLKKALTVILVGVAWILEPLAHGMPLAGPLATFFIVTEAISIVEKAGMCGIELPSWLTDFLAKLKATKATPPQEQKK